MIKYTDQDLIKLMRKYFTPTLTVSGAIQYEIKKLPIQYCFSCKHLENGCNIQDTICRLMAQEWPFALQRKELNNLCYEPTEEKPGKNSGDKVPGINYI